MASVELFHWHDFQVSAPSASPWQVVANVDWTHEDGVTVRQSQAFYTGTGNNFVFRFGAQKLGDWTGVTSSTVADLNGLTINHTVTALTNPARSGYHVPSTANPTWWQQQKGSDTNVVRIAPRLCMWDSLRFANAKSLAVRQAEVDNWADNFGMTGAHVPGPARNWFDLSFDPASIGGQWDLDSLPSSANPDVQTFVLLEQLIEMWLDKGGHVHIWEWADAQREGASTDLVGGQPGALALRIDRYIRQRLGPIPGWSMGYGFDNWENLDAATLGAWIDRMNTRIGWFHPLSCRFVDETTAPVGFGNPWDNCTDGVVQAGGYPACSVPWNQVRSSPPQVASWEQHWPMIVDGGAHTSTPQQIIDAVAANTAAGVAFMPDRPHFSEDRFFRQDPGSEFRDFVSDAEVLPVLEAYGMAGWGIMMGRYLGGQSVSTISQDWSNPVDIKAVNDAVTAFLEAAAVGPPEIGSATAVAADVIRLAGLVSGADATSHEMWANEAPGGAFDGAVAETLGATLPASVDAGALDPLVEYNIGIRAISNGDQADSTQVSATTLDVAHWTLDDNDTLIVALDEFADGDGVLISLEAIELRWGKYEDQGAGNLDLLVEIENDAVVVDSFLLQDATLQPQNENVPIDPPVENFVNLRLRITALMPGGANGQRAALYWIQGAGTVLVDAPPPVPTGTNAATQSDTEILASWNAVGTADGYRLQFAQGATFPAGTGTEIFDGTLLEFLHTGREPATQYAYRVQAYNDLGNSDWSAVFTATTDSTVAPPKPTGFEVDPISASEGDASWDPALAVDGYRIQLEPGDFFPPGTGTLVFDGVGTPDMDRLMTILGGLDPDTQYAARLASYRLVT